MEQLVESRTSVGYNLLGAMNVYVVNISFDQVASLSVIVTSSFSFFVHKNTLLVSKQERS